MDPRGAPERVLAAHTADEITGFARYGRASISPPSRFPSPIKAKAFAMPTDDGLWLHNDQHLTPVRQDPRKDHPQQPICQTQRRTWRGPLDRGELMAKRQELQLKNRAAAEAVAEQRKNGEKDDCIHARDAIQPRSRTPGFLPPIRFSGTTPRALVHFFPRPQLHLAAKHLWKRPCGLPCRTKPSPMRSRLQCHLARGRSCAH